jgi:GNAT superfamily N-acetyltransferase
MSKRKGKLRRDISQFESPHRLHFFTYGSFGGNRYNDELENKVIGQLGRKEGRDDGGYTSLGVDSTRAEFYEANHQAQNGELIGSSFAVCGGKIVSVVTLSQLPAAMRQHTGVIAALYWSFLYTVEGWRGRGCAAWLVGKVDGRVQKWVEDTGQPAFRVAILIPKSVGHLANVFERLGYRAFEEHSSVGETSAVGTAYFKDYRATKQAVRGANARTIGAFS